MENRASPRDAAREMLVFTLGGDEYAVDILKVQEIRGYEKVTPIPRAPDFLKGVVNLRGTIVPVVDLRIKFALAEVRYDAFTVVVVLRIGSRVIGAVVDGVSDVVGLGANDLKPAPQLGSVVDSSYLAGVATMGGRMILVLDIEKLLSSGELDLLSGAAKAVASTS